MPALPRSILVTGANGNLGRQLLCALVSGDGSSSSQAPRVRALVRSESAAAQVRAVPGAQAVEIMIGDYTDPASMAEAVAGCEGIVHLVGIIKENSRASYAAAHEETCEVLEVAAAEAGCQRIVYLSIFGSHATSPNPCLASKGAAEAILLAGRVPSTVLRVPMVLGPDDFASKAQANQAQARAVALVGGGATLQQPIDSRDVVAAVVAALSDATDVRLGLDLGGPECLSHRALLLRVAELHGTEPRIISIPLGLARIFAQAVSRLSANPPITPAMFEILQHDDRLDPKPACQALGIELTPLTDTLRAYTGPGTGNHD